MKGVDTRLPTVDEPTEVDANPATTAPRRTPFENALQRFAAFLSQHSLSVAVLWLGAVLFAMVGYSRQKGLWADEVIFRWISTLPSVREIWHALTLGLNTDPPLDHLLTHGLTAAFGSGALVLRLTSMCGIVVMLLCLFLTLRKSIGALYALLGLLLPFCTMLVDYGYEARPYALMYGCFGLAIFCWVKAGEEGRGRIAWNTALAVALSAALACHFYAVFALPAFYLGEAVRTQRRRGISWPTAAALAVASGSLLLYLPIIVGARQYSSSYFEKPSLTSIPTMLARSLDQLAIPLFAFLAFAALFSTLGVRFLREGEIEEGVNFRELTALGLGFLLVPLLAWGAGLVVLKAFTTRYVLHGLFGVFLLLPLFAGHVFRRDRTLALALLMACGLPALWFVARGSSRVFKPPFRNQDLARLQEALPKLPDDIVVSDPHLFLEMVNYSTDLKAKCIYLWDRKEEATYSGQDGFSHFAGAGVQMGWFRAQAWNDYPRKDEGFLLLTSPDNQLDGIGWLRGYLEAAHRYGDVLARPGQYIVVQAKPSAAAATFEHRGTPLPVAPQAKSAVH